MKKSYSQIATVVATAALARSTNDLAGQSYTAHLYLYEKDPNTWNIVDSGAWGKMKYNLEGHEFDFVLNGHDLKPNTGYTLVYWKDADPWPRNHPGTYIDNGISDSEGEIHLAGSVNLGKDIPNINDANYPTGGKIWLVLSSDYNTTMREMVDWKPTEYLFETMITYNDTDVP